MKVGILMENKYEKRGRKKNPEYEKERLLGELRKIQLSGNQIKLTYLGLEKITGIPRRNWGKVSEYINNINQGIDINASNFKCDFALPSISEVFDLYYGKNKNKLMEIFEEYNTYLNMMWEKYSNFESIINDYKSNLDNKEVEISNLNNEINLLKSKIEYYKRMYEEQCSNSINRKKREEENIKSNVISISNGDKNKMSMDFDRMFSKYTK